MNNFWAALSIDQYVRGIPERVLAHVLRAAYRAKVGQPGGGTQAQGPTHSLAALSD